MRFVTAKNGASPSITAQRASIARSARVGQQRAEHLGHAAAARGRVDVPDPAPRELRRARAARPRAAPSAAGRAARGRSSSSGSVPTSTSSSVIDPPARPGRPPRGRSGAGTASTRRSRGPARWKNAIESGSPPCSPQTPSSMPSRCARPRRDRDLDERADAVDVDRLERRAVEDPPLEVGRDEARPRRRRARSRARSA